MGQVEEDTMNEGTFKCPVCGIIYLMDGPYGIFPHLLHDHHESEEARWLMFEGWIRPRMEEIA
jgi:hypothetical protein